MDRLTGSQTPLCYAPFVVAGLAALILGFGPAEFQRRELFDAYGPGVVALVIAIAAGIGAAAFVQWLQTRPSVSWGEVLRLFALAGAFLIVASAVPGRMRIQADEYLLASTAYRLQLDGSAKYLGSGFVAPGGHIEATTQGHDKRGLLYPITVAALHRARGYAPANSIHVNLAFGLIGVLLAYAVVRSAAQPLAAFIAALLLATHPLHLWAARSGGMESGNLVLLLAGLMLVIIAFRRREPVWAVLLLVAGPLLAQARYESVLAGAAATLLGYVRLVELGTPLLGRVAAASAVFGFLPYAWQRAVPFEFGAELLEPGKAFFSAEYFFSHVGAALGVLALPQHLGWAQVLQSALAVVAVAAIASGRLIPDQPVRRVPLAVFVSAVAIGFCVILALVWGDLRAPFMTRLGLPVVTAIAILAGLLAGKLAGLRARMPLYAMLGTSLLAMGSTAFALRDHQYDALGLGPGQNASIDWLARERAGCRVLVVTPYSAFYLLHGYSTLMPHQVLPFAADIDRRIAAGEIQEIVALHITKSHGGSNATPALFKQATRVQANPNTVVLIAPLLGLGDDGRWTNVRCRKAPS